MEGLAYLTFDADVKEEFVEDKAAMQAMFQLTKVIAEHCGGGTCVGGILVLEECVHLPLLLERVVGLWLGCVEGPGAADWAQAHVCPLPWLQSVLGYLCSQKIEAFSMLLLPRW